MVAGRTKSYAPYKPTNRNAFIRARLFLFVSQRTDEACRATFRWWTTPAARGFGDAQQRPSRHFRTSH
jgi:hypothetical protein